LKRSEYRYKRHHYAPLSSEVHHAQPPSSHISISSFQPSSMLPCTWLQWYPPSLQPGRLEPPEVANFTLDSAQTYLMKVAIVSHTIEMGTAQDTEKLLRITSRMRDTLSSECAIHCLRNARYIVFGMRDTLSSECAIHCLRNARYIVFGMRDTLSSE
jgi:hypothetical protein